jgi:hypothetical protein
MKKLFVGLTAALAFSLCAAAQVKTEVPAVVPGAKPVTVEHIKIHGAALEGNLEGDAVDREVIVFLPPSYATAKKTAAIRWSMPYTVTPSAPSSGRRKSTCRKPSRAPSRRAPRK